MSHPYVSRLCTSISDQEALSYLSDIEWIQDPKDLRPYELVFVRFLFLSGSRSTDQGLTDHPAAFQGEPVFQ